MSLTALLVRLCEELRREEAGKRCVSRCEHHGSYGIRRAEGKSQREDRAVDAGESEAAYQHNQDRGWAHCPPFAQFHGLRPGRGTEIPVLYAKGPTLPSATQHAESDPGVLL